MGFDTTMFSYCSTKSGRIVICWNGKVVMTPKETAERVFGGRSRWREELLAISNTADVA